MEANYSNYLKKSLENTGNKQWPIYSNYNRGHLTDNTQAHVRNLSNRFFEEMKLLHLINMDVFK